MKKRIYYWINQLKKLLEILASAPDDQRKYIEKLGTMPLADELALELEDMLWVLEQCSKENLLGYEFISYVRQINLIFQGMSKSNNKLIWHISSLESSEEWKKIRLLARKAIALSE